MERFLNIAITRSNVHWNSYLLGSGTNLFKKGNSINDKCSPITAKGNDIRGTRRCPPPIPPRMPSENELMTRHTEWQLGDVVTCSTWQVLSNLISLKWSDTYGAVCFKLITFVANNIVNLKDLVSMSLQELNYVYH